MRQRPGELVSLSASYFSRAFKDSFGELPHVYIALDAHRARTDPDAHHIRQPEPNRLRMRTCGPGASLQVLPPGDRHHASRLAAS